MTETLDNLVAQGTVAAPVLGWSQKAEPLSANKLRQGRNNTLIKQPLRKKLRDH